MGQSSPTEPINTPKEHEDTGTAPVSAEAPKAEPRFTEADVERIVRDRLNQQARNKFGDYDSLKQAATKWQEHEDAQKSEMERLQGQLAKREQEAQQLRTEREDALKRAEFVARATSTIPPDRVEAAYKLLDMKHLTVNGSEVTGIDTALEDLLTRYPFLKETNAPAQPSRSEPAKPVAEVRNPSGAPQTRDLKDWYLPARGGGATFGMGGVIMPNGDDK